MEYSYTACPDFDVGPLTVGDQEVVQIESTVRTRRGVTVIADGDNTGIIYIGKANVTSTNGFPLAAGERLDIPVDNLNKIFFIASEADQLLKFIAF